MSDRKRYSDEELQEFKELIQAKLDKAIKEYELLRANIVNDEGNGISDTSRSFNLLEESTSTLLKSESAHLAKRQLDFIQKLQAALVRIENKTYGVCRETGELIPKDRLRAVPHATLSIAAKQK